MKPVRILTCLLVLGALAGVSLGANNVQSNFVPGDFYPAAQSLGIEEENGYYDLGKMLAVTAERVAGLDSQVTDASDELTGLTDKLARLDARIAQVEAKTCEPIALVPSEPIQRGHRATLVFRTLLGNAVAYRLQIVYLATGAFARDSELRAGPQSDGEGTIQWSWDCETGKSGPALAVVTAVASGVVYRRVFEFRVE